MLLEYTLPTRETVAYKGRSFAVYAAFNALDHESCRWVAWPKVEACWPSGVIGDFAGCKAQGASQDEAIGALRDLFPLFAGFCEEDGCVISDPVAHAVTIDGVSEVL